MEKIKNWITDNIWWIMLISLVLMIVGCVIVGCFDLNPLWYILCGVLGLGVLIPFVGMIIFCLIFVPILKVKNKKKGRL
ncbi:MAG: hypothetical protein J6S85_08990 [Methanobrevibacter sp.]|nr:hypothetical protein [Methanobrevibacter sp.]